MEKKGIIIFVVVIILVIAGLFGANYWLKQDQGMENENNGSEVQTPSMNTVAAPQQAGGQEVFIEEAAFTEPGYIVIHRVDETGNPGAVIGHSELLQPDTHANLVVSIDEEVKEGDELIAMLHRDNGNGTYEFPGDDVPIKNEGGDIVMTSFSIVGEGKLENEMKL